jgi:hypothetical protein
MGRNKFDMMDAWMNARDHNQMPNIVSTHPSNPTLRYHMREHTEQYPGGSGLDAAIKSVQGGYQAQHPITEEPTKKFRAKKPPKAVTKGAFPEPGMASAVKPCKNYEPAISIGHEHACGNCGWNHR